MKDTIDLVECRSAKPFRIDLFRTLPLQLYLALDLASIIGTMSDLPEIDLARAPRGEIAAARLVAAAAAQGDFSERHYLELKGPTDLTSKASKQKVAKFILGAANRLPSRAAEAFEGYGVMIIGISAAGAVGISPIEMLELSKVVDRHTGPSGPRWDIVRVSAAEPGREVLLVLVDPPKMGDPIFVCREAGDKLEDGRIYIRADGDTREVTSAEFDLLLERAEGVALPGVDIGVTVTGAVIPVTVDDATTLEPYILRTRQRLLDAMPKPVLDIDDPNVIDAISAETTNLTGFRSVAAAAAATASWADILGAIEEPEERTGDEYREEVDRWESLTRAAWPGAVERFVKYSLPPNEVRVENRTSLYLLGVEVSIHLDGAVTTFAPEWADDEGPSIGDLGLPLPPRTWGPARRAGLADIGNMTYAAPPNYLSALGTPSIPSTTWKDGGSVDVTVDVGDLRPTKHFLSDDGEAILVLRGTEFPATVTGTWHATARGHNEVFSGTLSIPVNPTTDLTDRLREYLGLG